MDDKHFFVSSQIFSRKYCDIWIVLFLRQMSKGKKNMSSVQVKKSPKNGKNEEWKGAMSVLQSETL